MAAGQYSAGTIFLQVVPVFRDTMDEIQDRAKRLSRAIGDDLEKSGRDGGKRASAAYSDEMEKGAGDAGDKAGKKYAGAFETGIKNSIKSAQREIDRLDFSTASENSIKDLDRVKRKLGELKDVDFSVDFNAKKVLADIAILEAAVKKMASGDHEINITANTQKVLADLRTIQAAAEKVEKKRREIRFEGRAEFKAAERQVGTFEKKFRAAMKRAAESLGDNLGSEIAEVRAALETFSEVDIGIDMDAETALAQVEAIKARLAELSAGDVSIDLELDSAAAMAALESVERKVEEVARETGVFEKKFSQHMRAAGNSIRRGISPEIDRIRAELLTLADVEIGVDMDAEEALTKARGLKTAMEFIAGQDLDIDVDVDMGAAIAQVALLDHQLEKLSRQATRTTATVGIMGALMTALRGPMAGAGGGAENSANAFRSFNFVILAVVTLLPALVPVLAAVGGGLLALIPILGALGAGLGVAILGFSGIGGALREMGNVADEQAAAAGKAEEGARRVADATRAVADAERALADARRNGARAIADAERNVAAARRNAARAAEDAARAVADAREQAAQAIEDALERQKDAQKAYRDSVKDVADAEQDLRDAREQAAKDAATLATRQRKNAVDERQALLDLGEAQNTYNAVMGDGSSTTTDKEQASVNLEQAQIALNDTRAEQVELANEAADYAKNGVDGSEKVQSAQDAVTAALEAQKEATEAVRDAAREADEARVDGAQAVTDALRDQKRQAADSARAIADAERGLADARRSAAQGVADAQRNLNRAQEAVSDAVQANADEATAAMDRLEVAMDKLSPAGRKFARFLFGLRGGFKEIRDEVQERMLPGVQRGLQAIIDEYGPKFKNFAGNVADSLGRIGESTGKGLGNSAWQEFFRTYGKLVPTLIDKFAENSGNWMTAWAGLFTVIAPYADRLADGLLKMSERAERFFTSAKGKKEIQEFMDYAFRVGPTVIDFFKDLAIFAKDVAKALAPLGELVLKGFNEFMEWVSSMDPSTLQFIATGIIGIAIAFMLALGAVVLFKATSVIFAGGMATIVFAVTLVVFAIIALYQRFPAFRKVVDIVIKAVVKAFEWLKDIVVNRVVPFVVGAVEKVWGAIKTLWAIAKPYLTFVLEFWTDVFDAMVWVVKTFLLPIIEALWKIVVFLWDKVIKPYLGFIIKLWTGVFKAAWAVIKHVVLPILDLLGHTIMWLYRNYVKPYFQRIKEGWEKLSDGFNKVWTDYIKPVFDFIKDYIKDEVAPKFQTAVDTIKAIWAGLKEAFAAPVRFLIESVVNDGIIKGFNWVAGKVGATKIDPVEIPEWAQEKTAKARGGMLPWGKQDRAVGGVLPGYTPGRDVYSFYSPQLGELNLSGGEGILRPEVIAANGEGWLNKLNSAAINGGVDGVRKVQGFAKGGVIFPVRNGYVNRSAYNLGHDGMDINHRDDATGRVPFVSATSGVVTTTGYSRGYGNAVFVQSPYGELVYGHSVDGSIQVVPGSRVFPGSYLANIGNTGNSDGAHLHFGFPGGTFYGAEALLAGSMQPSDTIFQGGDAAKGPSMPKWAKAILGAPLDWAKSLIAKPLAALREKFGTNDYSSLITSVPNKLISATADKAKGLIKGFKGAFKDDAGVQTEGAVGQIGDAIVDRKNGGVLPYNGTMKYDAGGYLPPGLTSVVNLTGKPEPVFTADQFADLDTRSGDAGFTYAPTFNKSDLTAADVVDDLDFTRRRIQREGRYGRNK